MKPLYITEITNFVGLRLEVAKKAGMDIISKKGSATKREREREREFIISDGVLTQDYKEASKIA